MRLEELVLLLASRKALMPPGSASANLFRGGTHAIGKKLMEEAAEAWMAAEHESPERLAEEIAQLIYCTACLMAQRGLSLAAIEDHL